MESENEQVCEKQKYSATKLKNVQHIFRNKRNSKDKKSDLPEIRLEPVLELMIILGRLVQ